MKSFHTAVQIESARWLVTFVSEHGFAEVQIMTAAEFIEMIALEARLTVQ
jgi:hypothetical protein